MPFLIATFVSRGEVLQEGEWNCLWFAEHQLCDWLEGDLQLVIFLTIQFLLEKELKLHAEVLAGFM